MQRENKRSDYGERVRERERIEGERLLRERQGEKGRDYAEITEREREKQKEKDFTETERERKQ